MHDKYRRQGNLETYIELLKMGIRDICMPNYGSFLKQDLDYIDKEAKKHGFHTMLLIHDRTRTDGTKYKSYQRIIYRKGLNKRAALLRVGLTKHPKSKSDHMTIGRILGYSKNAIEEFINGGLLEGAKN